MSLQGRKFVFDMHDFGPKSRILKRVLRSANCLGCIFSAHTVETAFEARFGKIDKPKLVLGNAIDPAYLKPRGERAALRRAQGIADGRIVVAYVGSMGKDRGIDLMLQTAARRKFPNLVWLFVGGRPDDVEAWQRQSKNLGLSHDAVQFAGFEPQSALGNWYEMADILCAPYPRRMQGWDYVASMKLMEYQAVGKLAVVATMPFAREILSPQDTIFFDPDEPQALDQALAKALETFASGRSTRAAIVQETWDTKAKSLIAWLKTLSVPAGTSL
ncbi:MAG: glycosyltransferase [Proteobacteria bacterium]|nr:glycosyltransferase [Pseudomonadota bacterium]